MKITKVTTRAEHIESALRRFSTLMPTAEGLGGHAPAEAFATVAKAARAALAMPKDGLEVAELVEVVRDLLPLATSVDCAGLGIGEITKRVARARAVLAKAGAK